MRQEIEGQIKSPKITLQGMVDTRKPLLMYLQFDGKMYIDTGTVPTNNTVVEVVCEYSNGFNQYLYGSRTGGTSSDAFGWCVTSATQVYPQFGGSQNAVSAAVPTDKITVRQGADGAFLNGAAIKSYDTMDFVGANRLYIGTCNSNGRIDGRTFAGKLYSFMLWENNVLKRNMKPYKLGDNAGLYDFVSKTFYRVIPIATNTKSDNSAV